MLHSATLNKAYRLISRIGIGESKTISELVTKPGGEHALIEAIKELIDFGFIEYEFSNDYTSVKRLNLPPYAIKYIKTTWKEHLETNGTQL